MTGTSTSSRFECGQRLTAAGPGAGGGVSFARTRAPLRQWDRARQLFARPFVRRFLIGAGIVVGVTVVACISLWWRLASGPIALDVATPWLTAAIEENFGNRHRVEVGGTQLERDENGRTRLRIRDIVVRDGDGTVVASAPKAEVGFSGVGLLVGRVRAERLNLVGAEVAVRIEQGGSVTVFAGADKRPIASSSIGRDGERPVSAAPANSRPPASGPVATSTVRSGSEQFAAMLSWIDGLGATGLDGHELRELGLKSGSLVVDDQRTGARWTFDNINLSLTRPHSGGVVLNVGSDNADRPWQLSAAIVPNDNGRRSVRIEASKVSANDLLLALRLDDGHVRANVPLSASLRGEIGPDGIPRAFSGRVLAERGVIGGSDATSVQVPIERAEFNLEWDATRRRLVVPFHVVSAGNRITMIAQADAPQESGGPWALRLTGGTVVLATQMPGDSTPLVINRLALRARLDPARKRLELEQGDIGNMSMGVALSGNIDFSGSEPRLAAAIAGTRMSVSAMKRLWPVFFAPDVREWVIDHLVSGTVEKLVVAGNAPFTSFKRGEPPQPDEVLSVEIITSDSVLQPVDGLPAIRGADLDVRITERTAMVHLGRGTVELPSGRKLVMSGGVFEVPETGMPDPPARVRFKLDGPVPAAAELLAMERLRDASGAPFEAASTRGTMTAQVALGMLLKRDLPRGSTDYAINVDMTNFAAERMMLGHRVEAAALRVVANTQGFQLKGDVRIGGTPAALDYRRARGANDAEIRLQSTLDEAARARLGFDFGSSVAGPVPIRLSGRVVDNERENKFSIEADLTTAEVDSLLPGWIKPAGRVARANFNIVTAPQTTRIEDLVVDGSGAAVRGSIEFDGSGNILSAQFPSYGFSDGDKASLKADRAPDGTLRVVMRGDVYDGRGFVKTALSGPAVEQRTRRPATDIDLDIKLGAVAGHNGEALRGLDLRLSRRAGSIRSFALNAKLGRDAPLLGDLRRRNGRQLVYVETGDAGALFRLCDVYSRMSGGSMWIAMDSPGVDGAAQQGQINVRDFSVRGEANLDRVVKGAPEAQRSGIEFTRMRIEFTRMPGKFIIRDGVLRGPVIGATVDGQIDYPRDEVRMRGTIVPLYGLNNIFGQIPIVGLFLGGPNEGPVGITYEVVGKPASPVMRVNPISAVAPGLLRKVFEFPSSTNERAFQDPAAR
jgi:Protein of unknown function